MPDTVVSQLSGLHIASFESRQREEMNHLIKAYGGISHNAPALREIPISEHNEILAFYQKLLQNQIQAILFMTGVGTKLLLKILSNYYPLEEILEAFRSIAIIARGPKPTKVLYEHKIPITLSIPEPNTWHEILQTIDESEKGFDVHGATIAIQEYGAPNWKLIQELQKRGAQIIRIPVYQWDLPLDLNPIQNVITDILNKKIHISLFTNAAQIHNTLKVAQQMNLLEPFKIALNDTIVSSVGPTCTQALNDQGIHVDIEPEHPKMGQLMKAIAEKASLLLVNKSNTSPIEIMTPSATLPPSDQLWDSPFLKACRREKTEFTPIWLMRQAGRYMKSYRDIRSKVSFIQLCKNSDLAAEVTIKAQEELGVDAAIIFSDILVIVEPMGLNLEYSQEDGPVIQANIQTIEAVQKLPKFEVLEHLSFVYDAIRKTRQYLKPNIPLIGFSGAPFTIASYIIEGGSSKTFRLTKEFMYKNKTAWQALMEYISHCLSLHLKEQINAGAQALQIFDSWVGCLNQADYREYVLPFTQKLIRTLPHNTPIIHFGTNTSHFLKDLKEAGGHVIGLDFRVDLAQAWQSLGHDIAVQGNLDPVVLFADKATIKNKTEIILKSAHGHPGHIFNLGHGVLPHTPYENVKYLIDLVHHYET